MSEIKPPYGAVTRKKRVGRGPGSGMGKTATRGHKGQWARKSGGTRIGFEGGQTPLYRRLPKRGFNNERFKKDTIEINVSELNKFDDNSQVDVTFLRNNGYDIPERSLVKILGDGELKKKLDVFADKFSSSAVKKIEEKGGKTIIIDSRKING